MTLLRSVVRREETDMETFDVTLKVTVQAPPTSQSEGLSTAALVFAVAEQIVRPGVKFLIAHWEEKEDHDT